MKKFIAQIGHTKYAIEAADAVTLLAIAGRCRKVEYGSSYRPPFLETEDQDCFVTSMELEEVVPFSPPLPEKDPVAPLVAPLAIAPPVKLIEGPKEDDIPF